MCYKSILLSHTQTLGTIICRNPSLKMEKETTDYQLQMYKGTAHIFELVRNHTHHILVPEIIQVTFDPMHAYF